MRRKDILNRQISQSVDRVNPLLVVLTATNVGVILSPLVGSVKQIRRREERLEDFVVVHHAVMSGSFWRKNAILDEAEPMRKRRILQKIVEIGRFFICHVDCNANRTRGEKQTQEEEPGPSMEHVGQIKQTL